MLSAQGISEMTFSFYTTVVFLFIFGGEMGERGGGLGKVSLMTKYPRLCQTLSPMMNTNNMIPRIVSPIVLFLCIMLPLKISTVHFPVGAKVLVR